MREEANGRTACGVGGGGGKSRRASPDNEVGRQHKPRRLKCLMGVGGGSTAGACFTYRRARACAWSASRRIERVSNIPRNELFRAALAVILRARERLRDVDGGQAHLDTILPHICMSSTGTCWVRTTTDMTGMARREVSQKE